MVWTVNTEMNDKEKIKVYKDAALPSIGWEILLVLTYLFFFIGFYVPVTRYLFNLLKSFGFSVPASKLLIIFTLTTIGFLPIMIFIFLLILKLNFGFFRTVITDESGITFVGLFKRKQFDWSEVAALNVQNISFLNILNLIKLTQNKIQLADVRTNNKTYYFPLSMKEKGQKYPEYYWRYGLVDENFNKIKEISPDQCSLYSEIQNHIRV
jgi:hypothetical protein